MKKILTISASSVIVIFLIYILTASSYRQCGPSDDDKAYREAFGRNYKMFSVEIPEKIDFAGENVPVNIFYVRESLDRELLVNSYWHSNTILMFKRAYRWFPIIDPILKKYGVPEDFFFLCMTESVLDNVVSPAGASGFWQFLKNTATSYGLEVSTEVDERYHVQKSTEAACKYLKEAHAKYNSWTLAAASYNMGMGALDEQLKQEKTDNYYDLQLNRETLRYVYRILALKIIFHNPVNYGFYLRKKDFYPPIPTQVITTDTTIADLADFAIQYKVSYRTLKELNPWLVKNTLTNKDRKKYEILIPVNGNVNYETLINGIEDDSRVFNDTLKIKNIR
jgi:membrane-bound lytic murein transglycosylase D